MSDTSEYANDFNEGLRDEFNRNYVHRVYLPIGYINLVIRELANESEELLTKELSTFDPVLKEEYRVQLYLTFYRIAYLKAILSSREPMLDMLSAKAKEEVRKDNELQKELKDEPEITDTHNHITR